MTVSMDTPTLFDVAPVVEKRTLPELVGSEKQIAWATVIRKKKLRECERHLRDQRELAARYFEHGQTEAAEREQKSYRAAVDILAIIQAQAECRFWIDRRENTTAELLVLAPPNPGNRSGEWS